MDKLFLDANVVVDFLCDEDAMQYFSAEKFGADIIITRNKKDFQNAQLPVYTPKEYLEMFGV